MPPVDRPYLLLARLQALLGEVSAANVTVTDYEQIVRPVIGRRPDQAGDDLALARALIARESGDYARAIELTRSADRGFCLTCTLYLLATIYDRAGNLDSALAVYTRFVTLPDFTRYGDDGPDFALAHERLGQLYERRGDPAKAAACYARFVELWKDADPALQPRVASARSAMARLQGVP